MSGVVPENSILQQLQGMSDAQALQFFSERFTQEREGIFTALKALEDLSDTFAESANSPLENYRGIFRAIVEFSMNQGDKFRSDFHKRVFALYERSNLRLSDYDQIFKEVNHEQAVKQIARGVWAPMWEKALKALDRSGEGPGKHPELASALAARAMYQKDPDLDTQKLIEECLRAGVMRHPLHDAVMAGNLARVRELLARDGIDVFEEDENGHNALAVAAMSRKGPECDESRADKQMMGALLEKVKEGDPRLNSALRLAFSSGNLEAASLLIGHGADADVVDDNFSLPHQSNEGILTKLKEDFSNKNYISPWLIRTIDILKILKGDKHNIPPDLTDYLKKNDWLRNAWIEPEGFWSKPDAIENRLFRSFLGFLSTNQWIIEENPNFVTQCISSSVGDDRLTEYLIDALRRNSKLKDLVRSHCGQVILQTAIERGDALVVKALADAGTDVTFPFSKPLFQPKYEGMTPLQYAIQKDNTEVVGALLETVADNKQQQLLNEGIRALIADPKTLHQHAYMTYYLVDNLVDKGGDVNVEVGGRSLIEALIDKEKIHEIPWALVDFLIDRHVALDRCREKLLEKAEAAGEQALVRRIRKEKVQVRKLSDHVSVRNLSHLLGDAFIEQRKDLEGTDYSESLPFVASGINHVLGRFRSKFLEKSTQVLERLEQDILQGIMMSELVSSGDSCLTGDNAAIKIEMTGRKLLNKLKGLDPGETLLIPSGWTSPAGGHAILMHCRKTSDDKILIQMINTGDGAELYHSIQSDGRKILADTVQNFEVSLKNLQEKNLFAALLEPRMMGARARESADWKYDAKDLYHLLLPFRISKEQALGEDYDPSKGWMQAQLSGTCGMRSILAYVRSELGAKEYKIFLRLLKIEVVKTVIQELKTSDENHRMIIGKSFAGLYRNLIKMLGNEGDQNLLVDAEKMLAELKTLERDFQEIFPEVGSANPALGVREEGIETRSAEVRKAFEAMPSETAGSESGFAVAAALGMPRPIKLGKMQSIEELIENLQSHAEFFQQERKTDTNFSNYFLLNLSAQFLSTEQKESLFTPAALALLEAATPEQLERFIASLSDLSDTIQPRSDTLDPSAAMALQAAALMSWSAAHRLEEAAGTPYNARVTGRRICGEGLRRLHSSWQRSYLNRHLENHFDHLDQMIRKINAMNPYAAILFDYSSQTAPGKEDGSMSLSKDSPELALVKAMVPEGFDWTQAVKDREEAKGAFPNAEHVDDDYWNSIWFYCNGPIPHYFIHLDRIMRRSWCADPMINHHKVYARHPERPNLSLTKDHISHVTKDEFLIPVISYGKHGDDVLLTRIEPGFSLYLKRNRELVSDRIDEQALKKIDKRLLNRPSQNKLIANLKIAEHSLRAIRSATENKQDAHLEMQKLIDVFSRSRNRLKSPKDQLFFTSILFEPGYLSNAIHRQPGLDQELLQFFGEAIADFESQIEAGLEVEENKRGILFCMENKGRVLQWLAHEQTRAADADVQDLVQLFQADVERRLKLPSYRSNTDQYHLHMIMLDSFHAVPALSDPDQACRLLEYFVRTQSLRFTGKQNSVIFNVARQVANDALNLHMDRIRELIEKSQNAKQIAKAVMRAQDLDLSEEAEWDTSNFPRMTAQTSQGLYTVNLLSCDVAINGVSAVSRISDFSGDSSYNEFFGKWKHYGVDCGAHLETQDSCGLIHLEKSEQGQLKAMRRKIDSRWIRAIPKADPRYPKLPRFPLQWNIQVWQEINPPHHYLLIDASLSESEGVQELKVRGEIQPDGHFVFSDGGLREWVDTRSVKGHETIDAMDREAVLWRNSGQVDPSEILQFPNFVDEQGNLLEFELRTVSLSNGTKEVRWVWKANPHLFLSENQKISGIKNFHRFLVVENTAGIREVLIPLLSVSGKKSVPVRIQRMRLKNGEPFSQSPEKNAFLAYLTLTHAAVPEDYARAFRYLKKAYSFEQYDNHSLSILGWIFTSNKEMIDQSAHADSVRLYAAWLADDNAHRHPTAYEGVESNMEASDLPDSAQGWRAFWANKWRWRDEEGLTQTYAQEKENLIKHYTARAAKIPSNCAIEKILDPQALRDWELGSYTSDSGISNPKPSPAGVMPDLREMQVNLFADTEKPKPLPSVMPRLRGGRDLQDHFHALLLRATSGTREQKIDLWEHLKGMRYDPNKVNQALRNILIAVLVEEMDFRLFYPLEYQLKDVQRAVESISNLEEPRHFESRKQQLTSALQRFHKDYEQQIKNREVQSLQAASAGLRFPALPFQELFTMPRPVQLPTREQAERPKLALEMKERDAGLSALNKVYEKYFTAVKTAKREENVEAFTGTDVEDLNSDYIEGCRRNQARKQHRLLSSSISASDIAAERKQTEAFLQSDREEVERLQKNILELANRPPERRRDKILYEAQIRAGKRAALTLDDCIALFLHQDPDDYRNATSLREEDEIDQLFQQTGRLLVLKRRADHTANIVNQMERLEVSSDMDKEDLSAAIQKLGEDLSAINRVQSSTHPAAFHVFQYYLGLYMHEHQIEGLEQMMPKTKTETGDFPNVLIQRIQGGGKTLVFGHLLALLKADGYHLSVHVAPTALYQTALYDMSHRSERLFRQKERTLTFDDHPARFTRDYLTWMENMLKQAIVNKEYVTVTSETLRSMRSKALKSRLQISEKRAESAMHLALIEKLKITKQGEEIELSAQERRLIALALKRSYGKEGAIKALTERNQLDYASLSTAVRNLNSEVDQEKMKFSELEQSCLQLENILSLIRERGVLTFDEVHQALDPRKELNMPFGRVTHPDPQQAYLLAKTIRLVAEDEEVSLKANQQSQMKEEHLPELNERIADALLKDGSFQRYYGLGAQITESERQERMADLKKYLLGNVPDVPPFVDAMKKEQILIPGPAEFIVLTRQLLAGNWLKDRLGKSVAEHHGLTDDPTQARVSIPYLANMIPAKGSEFSDQYVMMLNTFISYVVTGPDKAQVKDMIEFFREEARKEFAVQRLSDPEFDIKRTKAMNDFSYATGMNLFELNTSDEETISEVQKLINLDTDNSRKLLFDYVIREVFPKVEMFETQVCSNGQNTASMGKNCNGYSGTFIPNMAPVGSEAMPEKGTNGQTIDLLTRKNNDVWVVGNQAQNLITDLIAEHPESADIHAIIDVGGQFLGIDNEDAARMMADFLSENNRAIQGVLYFDRADRLCCMSTHLPFGTRQLSGSEPEVIREETGLSPEQLFTYYDQVHITGTDLKQAQNAIAVMTTSEHTMLFQQLQGSRRLRELDKQQRIVFAVKRGALDKIKKTTGKSAEDLDARDLILFAHHNEIKEQKQNNFLFCLQKMENILQQATMDKIYSMPKERRQEAFEKCSYLFEKNIAPNLFEEFAHAKENISMETYLIIVQKRLLSPLDQLFEEDEMDKLSTDINAVIEKMLPELEETIEVSHAFREDEQMARGAETANSEASFVQMRTQEMKTTRETFKVQQQKQQGVQDMGNERQTVRNSTIANEKHWSAEEFFSPDFEKTEGKIHRAGEIIANEADISALAGLFDEKVLVTDNFVRTFNERTDMLSGFQKVPYQCLVIRDKDSIKLLLCSTQDAKSFEALLQDTDQSLPEGRSMFLIRPPLKPILGRSGPQVIAGNQSLPPEVSSDPKLLREMVQILFLMRHFFLDLNKEEWIQELEKWMDSVPDRTPYRDFYEKHVLRDPIDPAYFTSRVHKILHAEHQQDYPSADAHQETSLARVKITPY